MSGIESKNDSSPNYELNPPPISLFLFLNFFFKNNNKTKTMWNKIKPLCFGLQRDMKDNEGRGCESPHQDTLPTGKFGEKQERGIWGTKLVESECVIEVKSSL